MEVLFVAFFFFAIGYLLDRAFTAFVSLCYYGFQKFIKKKNADEIFGEFPRAQIIITWITRAVLYTVLVLKFITRFPVYWGMK